MPALFLSIINESFFNALAVLAVVIAIGAILGRLAETIRLPSITGYFVSGLILGGFLLFADGESVYGSLSILSNVALAFIAFELGTRLHRKSLRANFSEVAVIVLTQAVFTIGLVTLLFILFGAPWYMAIIVGVIATATSPETIMVLSRKYKTKGHLTNAIMPHIGMDDIVSVILFSVALAIAGAAAAGGSPNPEVAIAEPFLEIVGSIAVGAIIGALLAIFIKLAKRRDPEYKQTFLTETVAAVLLTAALALHDWQIGEVHFVLSPILTPMFMGIFFTNFIPKDLRKENDEAVDGFTPPFILVFFALIGAQFVMEMQSVEAVWWFILILVLAYAVVRVAGKQIGIFIGSKIKKTDPKVLKFLVRALLPQATVSIGMAQVVLHEESLPEEWRKTLFMVILIAGILYQFVGPFFSRKALVDAHEIDPKLMYFTGHPDEHDDHHAETALPEKK
ncbi:MAG TPA: hypothetical protein DCR44_03450 [Acholeplasmatales bacterium]|nr:MAG: hypothetical protein A2Y16_01085 [Tenericutes bacterium GWF2_57_13]HAQ56445.1 hypothetical protein [Acholeplasmatales bacterium]